MPKPNKIRKSLKVSFLDGIFASCMLGLVTDYITPYALALKAKVSEIGLLSSIPNFFSSLIQLKSADITERLGSRKKLLNSSIFLHVLVGIPIIFIPYLFKDHRVLFLILFVTLFNAFNAFAGPAWSSLMADHIPYKMRGKYFGWRNKILGLIAALAAFLSGFILYVFKANILKGFFIIFSLAFICRFVSWCFLTRMYEPPLRVPKDAYFSFLDFIKRIRESNFAKFVIFVSGLNFCVNLASPFFSVFMLRDLKFNYITYTILNNTVTFTSLFLINRWGMHADKFGTIKVIRFTSFFIATLPFWWILNQTPGYLILIQILSGFAWSGFNLCATNFIYDAVTPEKRTRCVAYFNVLNGTALCLGALIGGYLVNHLPRLFGFKILSLFLISSILRMIIVLVLSRKIKEVRPVQKISSMDLFYGVTGLRPLVDISVRNRVDFQKNE